MLNRSASLAISTSVLKALPGKFDIEKALTKLVCMFLVQLLYISVKKPILHQTRARSYGHRYSYNVTFGLTKEIESTKNKAFMN